MALYIGLGADLSGCGTPAVRRRGYFAEPLLQAVEPAFSFLIRNEFYHAEADPFAVAVAHFPEGAGEEGFFDGVAEYEAIGQRWGIHGRYQGYALQPVPSFDHLRPAAGGIVIVGDAGIDDLIYKTLCHGGHELPPDREDKDEMVGLFQSLPVGEDLGVDRCAGCKSFQIGGGHDGVKAVVVEVEGVDVMAGGGQGFLDRLKDGIAEATLVGVVEDDGVSHFLFSTKLLYGAAGDDNNC